MYIRIVAMQMDMISSSLVGNTTLNVQAFKASIKKLAWPTTFHLPGWGGNPGFVEQFPPALVKWIFGESLFSFFSLWAELLASCFVIHALESCSRYEYLLQVLHGFAIFYDFKEFCG